MHAGSHLSLGRLTRRTLLGTAVASSAAILARPAHAQVKSVEIIAPAGPGGGYDQLARATQQVLESEGLASGVQVTNVPGAGGTIGLAQFVTGKKRGNNLLVVGLGLIGAIKINKAPVTLEQVAPLARLTGEYQPLVVAADSPIKSLDDLVQKFKADPGSVSWGGFALGSPDHLLCAMTVKATGGDITKLNYIVAGAGGEMLAQVMGGHITVATGGLNEFAQQVQAGKLRTLAISSPERLPGVDIPTFKEQGLDVELVNWRGLMAPEGMKDKDRQVLDEALGKMVRTAPWQSLVKERGWVDMYQPSEQFAAFLEAEQPRIGGLLTDLGLA
jgi:putative tricarboxylic transport membrane protein